MMRSQRQRPGIEGLERRGLLSAIVVPPSAEVSALRAFTVSGTFRGSYAASSPIPDVGRSYVLRGSGRLGSLGRATGHGSLQSLGFIVQGNADGFLTLSNGKGSVTLRLEGPVQPGLSPLPTSFNFIVEGGTGAYQPTVGRGTATVKLGPLRHGQGALTITLHEQSLGI